MLLLGMAAAAGIALSACGAMRSKPCSPSISLTRVEDELVYYPCAVDRQVMFAATEGMPARFEPSGSPRCHRSSIEVIVGRDGRPIMSTISVISQDSGELTATLIDRISKTRYEPARKNGVAVNQMVRWDRSVYGPVRPRQSVPSCG